MSRSSSLTKYLLFIPLSYIGYCYYEYRKELAAKDELASHNGNPKSLNYEYSRFRKCKTTPELVNILKKSLKYVRTHVTEPRNSNPQIIDCNVIDLGEGSGQWWNYPYHTKTLLKVNKYNILETQKIGFYSLLFWTSIVSKEQLKLTQTSNEEEIIKEMTTRRHQKCHEITKHSSPTSNTDYQKYFVECVRKTEVAARLLDKELSRIALLKDYKQMI